MTIPQILINLIGYVTNEHTYYETSTFVFRRDIQP